MFSQITSAICRGGWLGGRSYSAASFCSHASRVRPAADAFAFSAAACSSGSSITVIRNPPSLHRIRADLTPVEGFVTLCGGLPGRDGSAILFFAGSNSPTFSSMATRAQAAVVQQIQEVIAPAD